MVKYVVIDLSKLDGDKLGEMLTDAYNEGYSDAKSEQYNRGYESAYTTTCLNGVCIDSSMTNCVDTIALSSAECANSVIATAVKSSN